MSSFTKAIIGNYKPLFKRKIPPYPVYWKGDPQLRIFLPLFWMKLLKPKKDIPNNRVHFEVHPQMTKIDVKNYLEKIYKVPVQDVQIHVKEGQYKILKEGVPPTVSEDRKFAYITLGDSATFTFPDIMKDNPIHKIEDLQKDEKFKNTDMKKKYWDRLSLPKWFR